MVHTGLPPVFCPSRSHFSLWSAFFPDLLSSDNPDLPASDLPAHLLPADAATSPESCGDSLPFSVPAAAESSDRHAPVSAKLPARFHADHAVGSVTEICLFRRSMRSMVSNDTVNGTVQKSLQHCLAVFFRPERRIHTVIRITAEHRFLCHQEIVRTGFTGHLDTLCFGVTNDLHAAVSADVSDMNRHIGRSPPE